MNHLNLRRATALSFIIHVVFLLLAMIITKKPALRTHEIYTVKIVTQEADTPSRRKPPPPRARPDSRHRQRVPPPKKAGKSPPPKPEVSRKPAAAPDLMDIRKEKAERLKALKMKQAERHKLERLKELEAKLKSRQETAEDTGDEKLADAGEQEKAEHQIPEGEKSKILEEYTAKIQAHIREFWVFPDIEVKGMEAIISVTVMRNGTIRVNSFERPSGNTLYDRSALKAISRAGKVEPPPFGKDLDIGLVFRPDER